MKFHCDRCKTKYSISDDRVRGKILKIRCKNCSSVITVRESKSESAGVAREASLAVERKDSTQGQQALAGAFKKAVTEPAAVVGSGAAPAPVSLDAEWYVSIDGNQEGPFELEQARNWVRGKAPEDELYCWSEGYDDWLPIEKVSHFRGVRRSAIPTLEDVDEPTMIDSTGGLGFIEETPKPLFAATMAAVSRGQADSDMPLPAPVARPPSAPLFQPITPAPVPIRPSSAASHLPSPSGLGRPRNGSSAPAIPAAAAPPIPAAAAPAFPGAAAPSFPAAPAPSFTGAATEVDDPGASLEFDIGEASRVVDLPTLMAQRGNAVAVTPSGAPMPGVNSSPMLGRGSGPAPSLGDTGGLPAAAAPILETARPEILEPNSREQKRGGIWLPMLAAAAVIAVVAGVLIYIMSGDDNEGRSVARGSVGGSGNLGYSFTDPTTGRTVQKEPTGGVETPEKPEVKRPKNNTKVKRPGDGPKAGTKPIRRPSDEVNLDVGTATGPTGPLDGDDLMRVYRKNNIAIKMCYERALKKNPLLKVPKTWVDIKVGLSGRVSSVKIPALAGSELGNCMLARIGRWKFRETTEIFASRFPVVFDR